MNIITQSNYPRSSYGVSEDMFYLLRFPYHRYAINIKGMVYNINTQTQVSVSLDSKGYKTFRVWYNNTTKLLRHHRVIAEIFVPNHHWLDISELVVNHRDGVKTNNDPFNLEWVTKSQDCQHAYDFGLRDDNVPIAVMNTTTNNTTICNSYHSASRLSGLSPQQIHYATTRSDGRCYDGWYFSFVNPNRTHRDWNS